MDTSGERPVDHHKLLREAMAGEPGRASAPRSALEPERLAPHFTDYQILALIGRGGMGAVYKALQKRLGRMVAIKVLQPDLAAAPEFAERFHREARALASLSHPHVLTVHDFGQVNGLFYLVTEYVEGVNLRQLMDLGELSPAEALRIAPQICRALQYAHDRGVVHRDVKPENILIDTTGQVKIADFGLAKLARANDPVALTRSSEVFGTPHYMAPEQWRGSAGVDHRADIYSLGVVLYEMLTGQLPMGSFDPPSKRSGVPAGLDQVVRRTLAQRPEDRYQSARDVETELQGRSKPDARAGTKGQDAHDETPVRARARSPVSTGCFWLLALAFLLVFGCVGSWFLLGVQGPPVISGEPVGAQALLGATRDEVVQRLGPPLAISPSAGGADWSYRARGGGVVENALRLHDDRVIAHGGEAIMLMPNERPARGPYLGQALEELVREFGAPSDRSVGTMTESLTFPGGVRVDVHDGVIVGIGGG